jgi:ABC-type nitrate/sulfonate/bicarbonate transport system ATPase subunit
MASATENVSDIVLQVEGVSRRFGASEALRGIDFSVRRGEFVAVLGPSGCGKTTLLNLLSGFDTPTTGRVQRSEPTRTVFQEDGLFPWLSAHDNIAFGARHITDAKAREAQVSELLKLVHLQEFGDHFPRQLSGGMKQRVSIARALAGDAPILLLDEPFSHLDYLSRLRLRGEFARLLSVKPRTLVLVTHDVEEATQLADRVVILTPGPGRIATEFSIDVPRPRDLLAPEVIEATRRALEALTSLDALDEPAAST